MCKGQANSSSSEPSDIPAIAKFWRQLYFKIPKFNFPGTKLNVSFTVVSALFLMSVRLLATQVLQKVFGWPVEESKEAAASVAGVVHTTLLCPGLVTAFLHHRYNPSEHITKATQWWQDLVEALLQFCTGYMVYDATFIVLTRLNPAVSWIPAFVPDDYLFLGHHFMTATYMTQTRIYRAGHMSAMMCMLLGEASNPNMNTWFVTSKAITLDCCNGPLMQAFHKYNEMIFCAIYLFLRVIMGPLMCTHMSWNLLTSSEAKEHLPLGLRLFWNFMIWAVILGSYSWIVYTYEMLQAHMKGPEQEL
jgi:hypothetical protein